MVVETSNDSQKTYWMPSYLIHTLGFLISGEHQNTLKQCPFVINTIFPHSVDDYGEADDDDVEENDVKENDDDVEEDGVEENGYDIVEEDDVYDEE